MKDNPSYYSILPAAVRYSKDLTDFQKILFSEITALANKDGYCSASNGYFADLYDKEPENISRHISKLESAGFITRFVVKNEAGQIIHRHLFPSDQRGIVEKYKGGTVKNVNTPTVNINKGGTVKNVKGNNTRINTTSINNNSGDFAAAVSEFEEEGEPEPVKAKNQKAPPSSARPPQAENDTYRMFRAWADFAEAKTYMPIIRDTAGNPKMGKTDAGQLKSWATWLTNLEPGRDVVEAWSDYMQAAWQHGGKFIQDNFTPGVLLSQRLKIVHAARQAVNGSKEKKNDIYELYGELLRQ